MACQDLGYFLPKGENGKLCIEAIYTHNYMPTTEIQRVGEDIPLRSEPWFADKLGFCELGLEKWIMNVRKARLDLVSGSGVKLHFKLEKLGKEWWLRKLTVKRRHPENPEKTQVDYIYYRPGN